jgi:hypothetical protein
MNSGTYFAIAGQRHGLISQLDARLHATAEGADCRLQMARKLIAVARPLDKICEE